MIGTEGRRCPCWHLIYSREVKDYRLVTDPTCDHCGGTGYAEFLVVTDPRNVRRLIRSVS